MGEVEEAEAGDLADFGRDGAGEVEDAKVWEGGENAGRDEVGDGLPVGDYELCEAGEPEGRRRDRARRVGSGWVLALASEVAADAVPAGAAVAAGVPGLEEADVPLQERRPEIGQRRPVFVSARHGGRRRDDADGDDSGGGGGSHWGNLRFVV